MPTEQLMRPGEFARRLGVHSETVRRWLAKGDLEYVRFPSGERRIPESELTRMLAPESAS